VLGPVDPQVAGMPAVSILAAVSAKPADKVDDQTLMLAKVARKALEQVQVNMRTLLERRMEAGEARRIARALTEGRWTHDYPLMVEELRALGIPVATGLPIGIYELMDLFPQTSLRRPSVEYIPVPYESEGGSEPRGKLDVDFWRRPPRA